MKKRSLMLMLGAVLCAVMLAGAGVPVYAADGLHVDQHSQEEIKDHIANSDSFFGVHEEFVTEPVRNTVVGEMTEASKNNALATLNDIRYIAGLDPVELDDDYGAMAQAAAFVNMSIGQMSHYPASVAAKPDAMSQDDWDLGCYGARSSNLGMGYAHMSLATFGWTEDEDSSNISRVGHRRWELNPGMGKTGFGAADMYYAMYAFDNSGTGEQYHVAWPAANMPIQYFFANTPWSLSTGYYIDEADVKVKLTRTGDGKVWNFDSSQEYSESDELYFNVENSNYGMPGCIIFRPDNTGGYKAGDEYLVEITGTGEDDIEYTVNFFELYHHLESFDAKEATPNEEGNIEYWYCDGCDKYFSDEEGQNEISRDEAIIPKIPLEVIDSGSCGADGDNVTWELDNAGTLTFTGSGAMADYGIYAEDEDVSPFYNNDNIKTVVIEEGITTIGSGVFCGCSDINSVTVPYSMTNIGGYAFWDCWPEYINYNGTEEDWGKITINDGNELDYCTINTSDEHVWADEYTVDKEATCTEPGQKSIHCTDCGISKHSSITEIPALGHDYGEWTTPQEPSCSQPGITECVCSRCGLKQTKEIPALEHSFGEWEEIEASDCENQGVKMRRCVNCGYSEAAYLDPLGHDWEDEPTVSLEPTCTDDGSQALHCKRCGAEQASEVIPALGHKLGEWTVTLEPTCFRTGWREAECSVCGEVVEEELPCTEHEWSEEPEVETPATCKAAGVQFYECLECGATKEEAIPKLTTHKFGDWKTTKAATELAAGQRSRTCTVCGHVEKQTIAAKKPTLPALTIKTPKAAKKAATIKWTKLSKAKQKKVGYIQIQYSLDKTFKKGVKTVTAKKSAASKKIKKLTSKKTYYVRIRTYKKSGSVVHISKWSKVKSVRAK